MGVLSHGNASGTACAKFILLGEHFIVHGGVAALAFPVKALTTTVDVTVAPAEVGMETLHCVAQALSAETGKLEPLPAVARAMERATTLALQALELNLSGGGFSLEVSSTANFPVSRGFGSSASFAAALARALMGLLRGWPDDMKPLAVEKVVGALERHFHGKPSGVDAATVLSAAPVRFEEGRVAGRLENRAADFILLDGGERLGCKELVGAVARNRNQDPAAWSARALVMRDLVASCEAALARNDGAAEVARAVSTAHGILADMGLSTPAIDEAIAAAKGLGALSGKVSGAGAGGAVVIVAEAGRGRRVVDGLKALGYQVLAQEEANP